MASSDKLLSNEPRCKYTLAVFRSRIVVLMDVRLAEEGVASWTNKGRRNLGGNLGNSRGFIIRTILFESSFSTKRFKIL